MGAADVRIDKADIAGECAADDVLPMREGIGLRLVPEIAPDLGLISVGEHGADAADDDDEREDDKRVLARGKSIFGQGVHRITPFK